MSDTAMLAHTQGITAAFADTDTRVAVLDMGRWAGSEVGHTVPDMRESCAPCQRHGLCQGSDVQVPTWTRVRVVVRRRHGPPYCMSVPHVEPTLPAYGACQSWLSGRQHWPTHPRR
eukprot:3525938-Rhodomonas_salina.1